MKSPESDKFPDPVEDHVWRARVESLDYISMSFLSTTQPEIADAWWRSRGWLPGMSWGEYLSTQPQPMRLGVLVDFSDFPEAFHDVLEVKILGYREIVRVIDGFPIRQERPLWTLVPKDRDHDTKLPFLRLVPKRPAEGS